MHFYDLSPDAIACLSQAGIYKLLRPLSRDDARRVTVAQWLAAVSVIDPEALTAPKRRGRLFAALFLTPDELRDLDQQFDADVNDLRERLERLHRQRRRRSDPKADVIAIARSLVREMMWLMEVRYAGLSNGLRLPFPTGPRPRFEIRRQPKGGRPRVESREEASRLLAEIAQMRKIIDRDSWDRVSDANALYHVWLRDYPETQVPGPRSSAVKNTLARLYRHRTRKPSAT